MTPEVKNGNQLLFIWMPARLQEMQKSFKKRFSCVEPEKKTVLRNFKRQLGMAGKNISTQHFVSLQTRDIVM